MAALVVVGDGFDFFAQGLEFGDSLLIAQGSNKHPPRKLLSSKVRCLFYGEFQYI
jgi:hypothetical protein